MCYKKYSHFYIFFSADSALNRVKQRLQFLRPPPPKITAPLHLHQQLSSSSEQQVATDMDTTTNHLHSFGDSSNDDINSILINNDEHVSFKFFIYI